MIAHINQHYQDIEKLLISLSIAINFRNLSIIKLINHHFNK